MFKRLIRYAAYPVVAGGAATAIVVAASRGLDYWPTFPAIAAVSLVAVAWFERVAPYEPDWQHDRGDLVTDIVHTSVNLTVLLLTVEALFALREGFVGMGLWPMDWAVLPQIVLAGAVIDLGLYLMHRWSHANPMLWRLHAIHHSPERLYWLNGERRHPLSAVVLAAPGLVVVVACGAPPLVVAAWLSFLTVHLAFQHANIDYRVGPLRYVLGVAEIHRWHHKREYEDAQVNFGEFWLLWDRLFGTFFDRPKGVRAGDVGLQDPTFPTSYWKQIRWPFPMRDGSCQAPAPGDGRRALDSVERKSGLATHRP